MIALFRIILRSTKKYGQRLRNLRMACSHAIEGKQNIKRDEMILVRDKTTGKHVYDNAQTRTQRIELERIMTNPQIPLREVLFRHIPDVEDMTQMMAFFKEEIGDRICVACTHT